MRNRWFGVVAVLGLLGGPAVATAGASAAPTPAPKLSSMLLRVNQFPKGWRVTSTGAGSGGASGCLSPKALLPKRVGHAAAAFADHGGLPEVDESLTSYAQPLGTRFAAALRVVDRCKVLTVHANGETLHVHIGRMPLPKVGNDSAGFEFSFTVKGLHAMADVALVDEGPIAMYIAELSIGSPDRAQFEHVVRLAVADVR